MNIDHNEENINKERYKSLTSIGPPARGYCTKAALVIGSRCKSMLLLLSLCGAFCNQRLFQFRSLVLLSASLVLLSASLVLLSAP